MRTPDPEAIDVLLDWWRTIGLSERTFDTLMLSYRNRSYHNEVHLRECFDLLTDIFPWAPVEVWLAIFYHDSLIERYRDSEYESAARARKELQGTQLACMADNVQDIIMATKPGSEPEDPLQAVMVDVDTAILGADVARFSEYERQIREEYSDVDDATFDRERKRVMRTFLDRDFVFWTDEMRRSDYERRAQENLAVYL